MPAFFFGPPERRLFAVLHPAAGILRRRSILIASPFGQEAIRVHKFLRVIAERLARSGCDVLRFDFYGTGDSAGGDTDVSLSGCIRDVASAHAELRLRSPGSKVCWVGLRMGAAAMLAAAAEQPEGLEDLIAWLPVLDGSQHLSEIAHAHGVEVLRDISIRAPRTDHLMEAMGFALSAVLRSELQQFDAAALWPRIKAQVNCVVSQEPSPPLPASINCRVFPQGADWFCDAQGGVALVSAPALALLTELVGGRCD